MNLTTTAMLMGTILVVTLAAPCQDPGAYLGPDGRLKHQVVLSEEQGGIAGPRVNDYVIEPDGSYTRRSYTRYVNKDGDEERRAESTRRGKLTAEQLGAIARELASREFDKLPSTIGEEAKANPRSVTITVGLKRITHFGAPRDGGEPASGDDPSHPRSRFAAVARAIRKAIDPPPK